MSQAQNKVSAQPPVQTLSRGIQVLEILADRPGVLTIDELAAELGVHRSVCYRLVRTLEHHGLLVRDSAGLLNLGIRLVALSASVERDLRSAVLPGLTRLAEELGITCFLSVEDAGECLTVASVEPPRKTMVLAQRPGTRHPLTDGAVGKAMLAALPESRWPKLPISEALRSEVLQVRARGWATSHEEIIPGVYAVAIPLSFPDDRVGSLAGLKLFRPTQPQRDELVTGLYQVAEGLVSTGVCQPLDLRR